MTENELKSQVMGIFHLWRKIYEDTKKDREKYGDAHYNEVYEKVAEQVMLVFVNILHENFGVPYDELGHYPAYPKKYPYDKEA